ncbi:S49 family peptidase [Desulfatitalea tepidiphila]|uniref:S49 family peptidase n=1 Tax=Desulfatitalea tepidiphila TaxID=1185843 RepID=UPI0006B5D97B|nr:S49 family peptidase [Desulfatitalea tepidiphila]
MNDLMIDPIFLASPYRQGAALEKSFTTHSKALAVISIHGPLSHRAQGGFLSMLFGDTATYDQIRAAFQSALADDAVGAIVFDIDSAGGEVAGCFDLVDEIYQARGTKPIYAIANEAALSAAYAIASAADRVYLTRTAAVGSVGVMAVHVDQSGLDAKTGLKYTAIHAGSKKTDGNPHEALSKEAADAIQARVNATYDLFCATVARNRGLSEQTVKVTEAAIYTGADAVAAGLADAVQSYEQFIQTIIEGNNMTLKTDLRALIAGKKPEEIAEAMAACGFMPADHKPVEGILELCDMMGVSDVGFIKAVVKDGLNVEQVKAAILAARAENSKTIFSTVSATGTGEVNPLLADAKRRAGINGGA